MPSPHPITDLFNAITSGQSPTTEINALQRHFQHEGFFQLAVAQEARRALLRQHFSQDFRGKVFLTQRTLGRSEIQRAGIEVHFVQDGALAGLGASGALRNAILVLNNNDIMQTNSLDAYLQFFQNSPETIVALWDFDNHHWYPLSAFFAAHSDIYFPCHPDFFQLLSRYNRCTRGPVNSGVLQWSRSFLVANLDTIATTARSDQPLGMHIGYEQFRFRNKVINTLAQHYPATVGFQNATFHNLSEADRLRQWCGHKAHWIVPVMNDIPTRMFDALTTGGVPIVPDCLRSLPNVAAIAPHAVFYGATDIVQPHGIVEAANRKFDQGGTEQILERHRIGMEQHHVSARIETILNLVFEAFEIPHASCRGA